MSDWSDYAREVQAASDSSWRKQEAVIKDLKHQIKELEAERDEALNQLDSARHSVEVLEKRLEAELAELHLMKTAGVIEVASRNQSVSDYIIHWEGRTEKAEAENEKLRKALEIYQRERDRFRHAKPEMTGAYFLAGGYGAKDDNMLPEFVRIVPAYGCAWEQIYVKTEKTISYEGS